MALEASSSQQSTWSLSQPTTGNNLEGKTLEELVLSDLYYDIARNLPPDDVLTYMHQDDLLTGGQRDHYKMMKSNNQPEVERSEYLLECLRKGEPGFLKRLSTILRKIPPSSYIADQIDEKMMQLAMQQSTTLKSPARTDRTKKSKDNTYWMNEYKKMETKTRMQLRAKDREIKRLRKAILQLERENNDNFQRLLNEMRNQVDVVSKWIDYKAESMPQSSALVNMALSQDIKVDDIFTGTSESSSNQSTLERPPKHHPRKKELAKIHTSVVPPAPCTESKSIEKSPANHVHQQGYSDMALQHFSENVSNPQTTIESDAASDITRPLQVSELTGFEQELSMLDNGINSSTKIILDKECSQSTPSGTALQPVYKCTALPIPAHASVMYVRGDVTVSEAMQPTDGPSTPSTVKSNKTSPILSSPQGGIKPFKSTKVFRYGKERSPSSDQEDFRDVFRRIRGREPPTK